jgi:hypothetical protein
MTKREPETCTVELVTGSFVHLAMRASLVEEVHSRALNDWVVDQASGVEFNRRKDAPALMHLLRQSGVGVPRNMEIFHVNPTHVVAIYPLDSGPELRTSTVKIEPGEGWPEKVKNILTMARRLGFGGPH